MSNETTLDDVLALVGKWRSLALDRDNGLDDYYKQALDACADELEDHGPAIKAALEDARRYRWLRDHSHDDCATTRPAVWDTRPDGEVEDPVEGSRLDAAIDAAQEVGK